LLADDERRYWCKALNNPQSPRVPVNEQIVGRIGAMIGAPVCEVGLVSIPAALAGWEFRDGHPLSEGWVHASVALDPVVETHSLDDRALDSNGKRHAGICALYDWMGGSDPQWLVRGADREYFSHDHGHYFPSGPSWTAESLNTSRDAVAAVATPSAGLEAEELSRLAAAIEAATVEEIEACISNVPPGWPVTDAELDSLVEYLAHRRALVAERLRTTAGAV
jgi:hypothetical protein